jgi:hypothetical protein
MGVWACSRWESAERHTGSERFAELESPNGRLGTQRRRRGSSLDRACLQMRKDTVDDVGFGDHGDDFHFSAALGAYQWVHLEDFSDETGPGSPSWGSGGGSWVRLWLRR